MSSLTRLKLLFALLYFVQGGAISYFSLFQKPYLHRSGVPTESIALISSLLILPFILKVGFGLLSDRMPYGRWGKRKPLMAAGLALACLAFFLCGLFSPAKQLLFYSLAVVLASFCVAFFDAATDGLAIDRVPVEEQGPVQSYMVGGKALGVIVLSLLIGEMVEWRGYSFVFFSMAGVFLIPLLLTLKIKESPQNLGQKEKVDWSTIPIVPLILFAVTYSIISFGGDGLITLYLNKVFNVSEKAIGSYGSLRGLGAIGGSLFSGFLLSRYNSKNINIFGLIGIALGISSLGHFINQENFHFFGTLWGFLWGFQEVCFLSLCMKKLTNTSSAFAFSSLMAMGNLGTSIGEGIATRLTLEFTFPQVFLGLGLFVLIPLFFLFKAQGQMLNHKVEA